MSQNENGVAILTYHSLDNSGSVISTRPEKFRRQMKILHDSGSNVLSLREVANCLREKRNFPPNSVAITFDDGFRSVYDVALPVLKDYGFAATVFLVTDFCGKNNRWAGQPESIPVFDLLSWNDITVMAGQNIEFGLHTASHPDLTKTSETKLEEEIVGAAETLRKNLNQNSYAFAYPYGKRSLLAEKIVNDHFYAACSTRMDFVSYESDVHFLPRIDMYYFSTNNLFSASGSPGFRRFVRFRKTLRELMQTFRGN